MDIYWPLPLLAWSGLPVAALLSELLWRFVPEPFPGSANLRWLGVYGDDGVYRYALNHTVSWEYRSARPAAASAPPGGASAQDLGLTPGTILDEASYSRNRHAVRDGRKVELEPDGDEWREKGGITSPRALAGHSAASAGAGARIAKAAAGLARAPSQGSSPTINLGIIGGHMNNHPVGQAVLRLLMSLRRANARAKVCHVTLFSLPLLTDHTTSLIAALVDRVVNLPLASAEAGAMVASYNIDVLLFPDWQPFPDQQSLLYQQQRLAPVQVCFFVRGVSCVGQEMDLYLLPSEMQAAYLSDTPAASAGSALRPPWQEAWPEQVVIVNWPLLTPAVVLELGRGADAGGNSTAAGAGGMGMGMGMRGGGGGTRSSGRVGAGSGGGDSARAGDIGGASVASDIDLDGQIFFTGQPVALLPLHPAQLHPLMDEVLIKILQACPSLQIVIALPQEYFSYGLTAAGTRHKIVWARHLVRRLWAKAGSLYGRVRLLPTPVSPSRYMQLAKSSDVVLDSFPLGMSFYYLALALGVGTPVLSMRSGAVGHTGIDDDGAARAVLGSEAVRLQQKHNTVYRAVLRGQVKWKAQIGAAEGFYRAARRGLAAQLVAHNASHYFALASALLGDRERGYSLRIRILDAVDAGGDGDGRGEGEEGGSSSSSSSSSSGGGGGGDKGGVEDIVQVLLRLGAPWARLRNQGRGSAVI